jgi:hypothetical protein
MKCLVSCQVATDQTKSLRFALIIQGSRQSWAIVSFKPSELVRQRPIRKSIWNIAVQFGPHRPQPGTLGNQNRTTPVTPSLKSDETRVAIEESQNTSPAIMAIEETPSPSCMQLQCSSKSSGELDVFLHDRDTFCMQCTKICIFEQMD